MDRKFETQEFWDQFRGCQVSVQKPGKKWVTGKSWEIDPIFFKGVLEDVGLHRGLSLSNNPFELNIVVGQIIEKGVEQKAKRYSLNLLDSKIVEEGQSKLIVYSNPANLSSPPDIYFTFPLNYQFNIDSGEDNKLEEMPAVEVLPDDTIIPNEEVAIVEDSRPLKAFEGASWDESLKNIILVRHGDYSKLPSGENGLNLTGRKQILTVVEMLREKCDLGKIAIFSSTARRSCETSMILATAFEANWEKYEFIGDEGGNSYRYREVVRLLFERHKGLQTVIFSTHLPFCREVPSHLIRDLYDGSEYDAGDMKVGSSVWIDLKKRQVTRLT